MGKQLDKPLDVNRVFEAIALIMSNRNDGIKVTLREVTTTKSKVS